MKIIGFVMAVCCGWMVSTAAVAQDSPQTVGNMPQHDVVQQVPGSTEQVPRHIILMIGDGMGSEHVWAAWLCNHGKLNIERLPIIGLVRTPSASNTITDSAAAGTAIACGHKTRNGQLGITPDGEPLDSILVHMDATGRQMGLVVTKAITDATPAAFYAHCKNRYLSAAIAADLVESGCRVIIGGGSGIISRAQQEQLRAAGALLRLEGHEHCLPASRRGTFLPDAVGEALRTLESHPQGFFLMVEGSQIDTAAHANDLAEVVQETLDFDRAVGVVLEWMQTHPDTLLIVTADHQTGGLSLLGGSKEKGEVTATFSTGNHSGVAVPLYATGAGAAIFGGVQENTELMPKILRAAQAK